MTQAVKDAAKLLKATLRLPASSFPARPTPSDTSRYLPRCTDDLYAWQRQERSAADTFVLHDGPPYANGELHVGHALNKILKDIICRSKVAQGKRVTYVPGWDCHGLPIELKARQHHGWKQGQDVDATALRQAAQGFAQNTVIKQMEGFKSWGVMGDWDNHWKTMDPSFELRQLEVFKAMVEHGLVYRAHKPVFWSPSSGTALAEAELEYKDDHISTSAYVKFRLHQSDTQDPVHVVIWTTTPWTLPANQAIAFSRSIQYCLVRSDTHGALVIARSRLLEMEEIIAEPLLILQETVDQEWLSKQTYLPPLHLGKQDSARRLVVADFVTDDSGTGLVHCAPAHGMEDYLALQPLIKTGLIEVTAPVTDQGVFDSRASPDDPALLEGQGVFTAGTETVLKLLKDNAMLIAMKKYTHKYPIDWRTKEPIIIRATAQWFADVSHVKNDAIRALEKVTFVPESGRVRLRSFVEGRSEWCISRQRAWGVPIPALYHVDSGKAVLTDESVTHIINVIKERGIDAWWSDSTDDPTWIPASLKSNLLRRGTDTMDVWFDSGTSWTSLLSLQGQQERPLADVYIEGTDQHRGWFQSSLLTHVAHQKASGSKCVRPPFASLITHGFTLDSQGKKMSKSVGNVIRPDQIIAGFGEPSLETKPKNSAKARQKHASGPDALRLWVASSDWTKDVVISDTIVKNTHTVLDKYRVTVKLLLGLLAEFTSSNMLSYDQLSHLDRIALLQLYDVTQNVHTHMQDLEFHRAVLAVSRWVATDLSGFYFEAIKDVCYCDSSSATRRASAMTTLHHIFCGLQGMLGPMLPLLVEESWEHCAETYKTGLVHPLKRVWKSPPIEWDNDEVRRQLHLMSSVNSTVKATQERARADGVVGQSLGCDVTIVKAGKRDEISSIPADTWKEILVVSRVTIKDQQGTQGGKEELRELRERSAWFYSASLPPDADSIGTTGLNGTVYVTSPEQVKCARCWRYNAEPAEEEMLPLCKRCEGVVGEFQH